MALQSLCFKQIKNGGYGIDFSKRKKEKGKKERKKEREEIKIAFKREKEHYLI